MTHRRNMPFCAKCGGVCEYDDDGNPIQSKKPHFIAMGGLHGCLPSHYDVYDTWQDAVTSLVDQYELGKKRTRVLDKNGSLELNSKHDGNEYIEIVECDCDTPEVHNDV